MSKFGGFRIGNEKGNVIFNGLKLQMSWEKAEQLILVTMQRKL